jgi:RNA-directed DNA polymerase
MKRHGGLWVQVVRWDNLLLAARKAQRGKRSRAVVERFNFFREWELLRLQRELMDGRYAPGPFRSHWIERPKRRLISAAPYRDRVVHHALMNVLEPILDRRFHPHSYACRTGKGTHAAADRLQNLMRRRRYVLQCDVRKFFPSIDHHLLKTTCRRFFKDGRVLGLLDLIIDHSNEQEAVREWFPGDDLWAPWERRRGLPIGNLTSQWLANAYLDDLDHFVTSKLGIGAYVRYCDDFVLLHDDPRRLRDAADAVSDFLASRRLQLHESKRAVTPTRAGRTFVGYRIWPTHRLLPKENVRRMRRRVSWMKAAFAAGRIEAEDVRRRLAGWIGHALRANTQRLLRRLSREWAFCRKAGGL